ncbi:hypothetical protein [Thermococcus sp. Bubb.Bath]|uniref:hypothetical protein n=1 Tax=Thermococcus sp. Bubb.Bath TaxID=1638242 RepID=UPI001F0D5D58|nr:hypothetical protein [Thermococcus sp. Bubb.Bath]
MGNAGIDWRRHLHKQRLMIIDTFGSIYGIKTDMENVWYLKKSVDIDTLNDKYIDILRAHKEKWKQLGMFGGRELWGVTISMSDYLNIFGLVPTQKYLELSDLKRATSDVYKKYPAGTNVWVYSGNDTVVLPLIYRKADYVIRTESTIQNGKIRRFLRVLKAPGRRDVPRIEYGVKDWKVVLSEF